MMEEMLISMLQKMTGLNPEQMQGMAEKAMSMLDSFTNDMEALKNAVARIETILAEQNGKVIDYVESDDRNAGTRTAAAIVE